MKIAKQSWHYRLNDSIQGYSFVDRLRGRKMTTCSYIRTTIRSMLQLIAAVIGLAFLGGIVLAFTLNALYVPLAIFFDLPLHKTQLLPAFMGMLMTVAALVITLLECFKGKLRKALSVRQEKQLSLLEQRIKDGKEGICTIVEAA